MENKRIAIINAKIFTSNRDMLYVDSMVVADGKITWIGFMEDMPVGDYDIRNLKGKTILPGIIDAHLHPFIMGEFHKKISCVPPKIQSIDELVEAIRQRYESGDYDGWIEGWGYNEDKFLEGRPPIRHDLDKATTEVPVCIVRSCAHIMSVNSKALEIAGITKDTPDPIGGQIGRCENGEPNGILYENARELVEAFIPKYSREERVQNLCDIGDYLAAQGITAMTDMANFEGDDIIGYFHEAENRGFKQAVGVYYLWDYYHEKENVPIESNEDASYKCKVAGIKLIGDGSISGRTAWFEKPYLNSDAYGISVCSNELVDSAIEFCKKQNCQLSIHAMGSMAVKRIVDRVYDEPNWINDDIPHLRLEHVSEISDENIKRVAEKKIAIATQPNFAYCEIEGYIKNLGEDRVKGIMPAKKLLDGNIKIAFSSDAPATSWQNPSEPFLTIKSATTRLAHDGTDYGQEEKVDVETAIILYTKESAEISGLKRRGQLKKDYFADFIVLDKDIFDLPLVEIDTISVEQTYIDGELVYCKEYK